MNRFTNYCAYGACVFIQAEDNNFSRDSLEWAIIGVSPPTTYMPNLHA